MNNFFYNDLDYTLFKKAFKATKGEPVVINILSTDSSLSEKKKETKPVVRKNYSSKYEPSPFGRFFGPRKQQPASVDMKNFSSWKNKNYRDAEKRIDKIESNPLKFSISDFMNERSKNLKYNELDQTKNELQKPITQLSSNDPLYKRFSLDSYMHKLEEQTKVKSSFEQNDDILEPLGDLTEKVVPDSSQDENFSYDSDVNIEGVALGDTISGEKYSIDKEELDKVKSRLERMEKEIKDKSNEKILSTEISDLTKDEFDLEKLSEAGEDATDANKMIEVDDIEKVNEKVINQSSSENDEKEDKPTIRNKKFVEINRLEPLSKRHTVTKTDDDNWSSNEINESEDNATSQTGELNEEYQDVVQPEDMTDENGVINNQDVEPGDNVSSNNEAGDFVDSEDSSYKTEIYDNDRKINRDDILTKDDFRTMTDEFMQRFTELYKKNNNVIEQEPYEQNPEPQFVDGSTDMQQYQTTTQYPTEQYPADQFVVYPAQQQTQTDQNELKAKIQELIEQNKKADNEAEEKLKQAKLEKEKVAEEYENRIKQIEENYKKSYEEFKQKAYLEKLDSDVRLQQAEDNFKRRELKIKEKEKAISNKQKSSELLKKEIKSNVSISNLEMEKKLLEESAKKGKKVETKVITKEKIVEVEKPIPKKPTKKRGPKKKRRKIDSDIIGNIDFD